MASLNAFSSSSSASSGRLRDRSDSLSVVVSPQELQFVEFDRNLHSRVLTIYNLYSFGIQYEVSCTAPDHYRVVEASGNIKAKCSVDLVVRYQTSSAVDEPLIKDKFRINIFKDKMLIGHKTIPSILIKGVPGGEAPPPEDRQTTNGRVNSPSNEAPAVRASGSCTSFNVLIVLAAILSMLVILLPQEGDRNSANVPPWLCMTVSQKLCAAFILGMITTAILRL